MEKVTGIGGRFFAPRTRARCKGRNLAENPNVAVHPESGDDVVILEGVAGVVTDPGLVERLFATRCAPTRSAGRVGTRDLAPC